MADLNRAAYWRPSHDSRCRVTTAVAMTLVAVFMSLLVSRESNAATKRPNFVLMMADDQGWGDVAYNGHPSIQTPNLDSMAAESLRLDRFYAAAPVCSPTRGSVLTGRHPNRFGCFKWGYTLRPEEITIAEALKSAGYATGHFGKWHLGSMRASSPVSPGNSGFDEWFSSPNFYENDPLMSRNGKVVRANGESSEVVVDAALAFIRNATKQNQPFLAVVWFGSPHSPHIASEEIRRRYPDLAPGMQNYLGEITGIDLAVGKMRRELREMNVADNTVVWYTSDNGAQGPGSTGGLRGKKGSLWEGGIRVPAIIEWPARIKSPRASSVPGDTVDIFPTLMELAGLDLEQHPHRLDGISLVPLLDGKMTNRNHPMGFWDYPAPGLPVKSEQLLAELAKEQEAGNETPASLPDTAKFVKQYPFDAFPGHSAWMDDRYKLHRIQKNRGEPQYELYDLVQDQNETEDISATHPDRVKSMASSLDDWLESVVHSLNGKDYSTP